MEPNANTKAQDTITLGTAKADAFIEILLSIGYNAINRGHNLVDIYGIARTLGNLQKLQKIRDAVERITK